MNVQQVLDWVKNNLVIVILVVVMIAAAVGIPMWASTKNAAVKEQVDTRYRKLSEITSLEKTTYEDPVTGETQNVIVNEALLREYEKVVAAKREDAEKVRAAAVEFNRNAHELITPPNASESWIFPAPPEQEAQVRPKQFHELLVSAYRDLLDEVNAGTPPDPAVLAQELKQKSDQFKLHSLSKTAEQALTEQEQQKLTEELREFRLGRYQEVASTIALYADFETLNVPGWNQQDQPTIAELFQWQWQYWIISDVLRGLSRANANSASVLQAPVKRLMAINQAGAPSAGTVSTGGGAGAASGGGGAGMMGPMGGGRKPPPGSGGASGGGQAGGQPINPNKPVPVDYSVSFTGRTTNPLYDVRYVQLSIIADTKRLPQIVNALAAQNFITVLDMNLSPADPFEHVRQGYMYGSGTVSRVNVLLETIWLREWTSEHMPDELRASLGIPPRQPQQPTPPGQPQR